VTWTTFKPKGYAPRPAKQLDGYTPRPRASAVAISDGKARLVVPVPKGPACKPGKTAPTVAESAWMDAITTLGCIACILDGHQGRPGAVHHILSGGRRMGHLFTLCLCQPGHHMDGAQAGMVSRHPWKTRFEERYGSEASLLEFTKHMLDKKAPTCP
jgi:Recombination enhancement, RecA-dependent nuclease